MPPTSLTQPWPIEFLCALVLLLATDNAVLAIEKTDYADDSSSMIQYSGSWGSGAPTNLDYGGGHQLSEDAGAWAVFSFTGHAVGYVAPKWPYSVHSAISLDGGPAQVVEMIDHSKVASGGPETVAWSTIWSADKLNEGPHTVRVSMATGAEKDYAVVDAFWYSYNAPDPVSSTSTPIPSSSSSSSTSSAAASSSSVPVSTSTSKKTNVGAIAGGVIGGLAALIALAAVFLLQRQRKRPESFATSESGLGKGAAPYGSDGAGLGGAGPYYGAAAAPAMRSSTYSGHPITPSSQSPMSQLRPASYSYVSGHSAELAAPAAAVAGTSAYQQHNNDRWGQQNPNRGSTMYSNSSSSNPRLSSVPESAAVLAAARAAAFSPSSHRTSSPASSSRDLSTRQPVDSDSGFDPYKLYSDTGTGEPYVGSQKEKAEVYRNSAVSARADAGRDGLPGYSASVGGGGGPGGLKR